MISMEYIKPIENIFKKISKKEGKLFWIPCLIIEYEGKNRKRVLFDAFTPDYQEKKEIKPFLRVLFARSAELFQIETFPQIAAEGIELDTISSKDEIIDDLQLMVKIVKAKLPEERRKFEDEMSEELQKMVEWSRFRWYLTLPERRNIRALMSAGKRIENIEMFIIKDILETGLGIYESGKIGIVINIQKVFYPLYVTDELIAYEVALKKDISRGYTQVIQSDEKLKSLFTSYIKE
ncbi:MAG: hypothetical protein ACP6IS_07340 [Candidatus Asgardarchaeia archaeon]